MVETDGFIVQRDNGQGIWTSVSRARRSLFPVYREAVDWHLAAGHELTSPVYRLSKWPWCVAQRAGRPGDRLRRMDSLEAEKAGGVLFGHHVDLGLAEARFCEDKQSHLKGLGVVHSAGLAEIGAYNHVCRTERPNI